MSANQAQNKGTEVVLVPLLRLPMWEDRGGPAGASTPVVRASTSTHVEGKCQP